MEERHREPGIPTVEFRGRIHVQEELSERRKSSLLFPVPTLSPLQFRQLQIIEDLEITEDF